MSARTDLTPGWHQRVAWDALGDADRHAFVSDLCDYAAVLEQDAAGGGS